MRLQLTACACLLALVAPHVAGADPTVSVDSRSAIYRDSDRTTIITTNVAARGNPTDHFGVSARYLADIITSASVDVVTAATTAFNETRHEIEAGANYHDDTRKITGSYIYSVEHDWRSHTGNLGFTHDFSGHDFTLNGGATLVINDVGRAGDDNFHRNQTAGGGAVGLTIVASPVDLVDVGYTLSYVHGYQASPYRYVSISSAAGSPIGYSFPETDPNTRVRHTLTVRYNHHLFEDSALRTHARGYFDDWGVASITGGAEYVAGFGDLEGAIFARAYAQRHATFYQGVYPSPRMYMTADRELSSFADAFGGLRLLYRRAKLGPFAELHAELRGTGFAFHYFDFPRLSSRTGVMAELGFGVAL